MESDHEQTRGARGQEVFQRRKGEIYIRFKLALWKYKT